MQKETFLNVLITVGTTQFQDLVKFTDSQTFIQFLKSIEAELYQQNNNYQSKSKNEGENLELKYFKILFQIGKNGAYIPKQRKNTSWIRLSDRISTIYKQSDIIICHGGAGTLLQNLKNGKTIISVANNTLAGNHQVQLIEQLKKQNYILGFNSVKELSQNLAQVRQLLTKKMVLKEYPKQTKNILNEIIFGTQ